MELQRQTEIEIVALTVERVLNGVDTERREVLADGLNLRYDYLVIATGATHSYFGQDACAPFAPGLKRVDDATLVRRRVLEAFERAEVAASEAERRRLLSFVIVGGGPTGCRACPCRDGEGFSQLRSSYRRNHSGASRSAAAAGVSRVALRSRVARSPTSASRCSSTARFV